jgi:chromosomal replication initiation ATPase DnaA
VKSKQRQLAEAASLYFNVPLEGLTSQSREQVYAWPRHVCQWIACDAGYKKPIIARFWNRDRTVVYNSVKRVNSMMKASRHKEKEVKDFMVFAKSYLNNEQGEVPK